MFFIKNITFIIIFFSLFLDVNATITVLNYYRMGETDPGAVAGNLCNISTIDSVGGKNLKKGNNPSYSSGIAAPILGGTPSLLSIAFTGSPQDFFSLNSTISDVTTNFVLEAFVKSFDTTSSARLVYNGRQFTAVDGFGFMNINGVYKAAIGTGGNSLTTFGAASVTTDWVHLALVRDNTTATFYVNGMANASSTVTPTTPTGSFLIGSTGRVSGIDEVRFSTFSAGAFQTSDLLYQSVPEPSFYAHLLIAILLLCFRRFLLGLQRHQSKNGGRNFGVSARRFQRESFSGPDKIVSPLKNQLDRQ